MLQASQSAAEQPANDKPKDWTQTETVLDDVVFAVKELSGIIITLFAVTILLLSFTDVLKIRDSRFNSFVQVAMAILTMGGTMHQTQRGKKNGLYDAAPTYIGSYDRGTDFSTSTAMRLGMGDQGMQRDRPVSVAMPEVVPQREESSDEILAGLKEDF